MKSIHQMDFKKIKLYPDIQFEVLLTMIDSEIIDYKDKLHRANLSFANLSQVDLSEAEFSYSIIIEPQSYELTHLYEKTNFKDAVSDIIQFIYHTSKFTETIPNFANNKKELKRILEKMVLNKQDLEYILGASDLPEK